MSDEIRLQFDFVNDLRLQLTKAVGSFADVLYLENQVSGAPRTADALGDFHGRWDLRRSELSAALQGLEDGMTAIRDGMIGLDDQLAGSLRKDQT